MNSTEHRYLNWQPAVGETFHAFRASRFYGVGTRCVYKKPSGANCNRSEQHPVHEMPK